MKKTRFVALIAVIACASALIGASSASASLITLGPPLSTTTYTAAPCTNTGGCTIAAFALPTGSLTASPVDGAIISWSLEDASATPGYAIRVMSRAGTSLTGLATSAHQTPAGAGLETFATALPIKQGQLLGIDIPQGGTFGLASVPGVITAEVHPIFPDGSTKTATEFPNEEVAFSALVQPAPTISAVGPTASGPTTGGTGIVIAGSDLERATSVKFGAAAAPFTVTSENSIAATSPPSVTAGTVPITVTTVAGTATAVQQFTYTSPPPPPPAPTCKVPKLQGKTLKSAKKRIRAAACRVGKLTKKEGATAKDGEVVKQVPKPGATVPAKTKVKVTLAP